jgi:hypothetical protein
LGANTSAGSLGRNGDEFGSRPGGCGDHQGGVGEFGVCAQLRGEWKIGNQQACCTADTVTCVAHGYAADTVAGFAADTVAGFAADIVVGFAATRAV